MPHVRQPRDNPTFVSPIGRVADNHVYAASIKVGGFRRDDAAGRWRWSCYTWHNQMFRRLVASWFVVLALSPFTAPFVTCDLSAFRPEPRTPHLRADAPLALPATLVSSPAQSHSTEPPAAGRARFVVRQQSASFLFPSNEFRAALSRPSDDAAIDLSPPGWSSSLRI